MNSDARTSDPSTTVTRRAYVLLAKDGKTPLAANVPVSLSVGAALTELAQYVGYTPEPSVSTRYALLAASPQADDYGEFTLVRDDATFADLDEGSLLRIAPQPRPARNRVS